MNSHSSKAFLISIDLQKRLKYINVNHVLLNNAQIYALLCQVKNETFSCASGDIDIEICMSVLCLLSSQIYAPYYLSGAFNFLCVQGCQCYKQASKQACVMSQRSFRPARHARDTKQVRMPASYCEHRFIYGKNNGAHSSPD